MSRIRCPKCSHVFFPPDLSSREVDLTDYIKRSDLSWKSIYNLKIPHIDDQHRKLVESIVSLHKAVQTSDLRDGMVMKMIVFMDSYVRVHLMDEEKMLEKISFPDLSRHNKLHAYFLEKVEEFKRHYSESGITASLIIQFLIDWFIDHVQTADREYAAYITTNNIDIAQLFSEK